jgi:predicted RNase H-like HicB family nuclease
VKLSIELDREVDGRWIAGVPELPGVLVYGADRGEAIAKVKALALRVIAEQIEHGECDESVDSVGFAIAA